MSKESHTAGVDEAGRGPVLGSMFVGGVVATQEQLQKLDEIGLKDSKKLSDSKRRELGEKIRDIAKNVIVREITAPEIDELREIVSLNVIETRAFADIIASLEPDKAYIDLPEPDGERFGKKIINEMPDDSVTPDITAEHGADDTYPVVSAASIVAKNAREDHINQLEDKYAVDIGSGYPHDQPTTDFLKQYYNEHGELPSETRRSWSTAQQILDTSQQKGLSDF